jgi:DNA-directed RNA polymerase specialized sigma24 family protein
MDASGSVTAWISALTAGDPEAAQRLWERYFDRLVRLAGARLKNLPRRVMDEEDVALSAFDSFCRGAQRGRFPQLRDRHNLWPLLVVITTRKAADLVQHQCSQKQGGGKVRGESVLLGAQAADASVAGIEAVLGREPTPAFACQVAEQYQRLLESLGEERLRQIAVLKMENYTNEEVAARVNCCVRTVERKLHRIRAIWSKEIAP